jgi:hypothetical protein
MAARQVFRYSSPQGDVTVFENEVSREVGFNLAKAPTQGGSKRNLGTIWLPAGLILGFVDSLQSLDVVVERAAILAAQQEQQEAEE